MSGFFDHTESEAQVRAKYPTPAEEPPARFRRAQLLLGLGIVLVILALYVASVLAR